jgi:hypothetical protein
MKLLEKWSNYMEERKMWRQKDLILPIGPGWEQVLTEQLRSDISIWEKIGWIIFIWTQFTPIVGELIGIQVKLELEKQFRKDIQRWKNE